MRHVMERYDESKPLTFVYEYDGKVVTIDEAVELIKAQRREKKNEQSCNITKDEIQSIPR